MTDAEFELTRTVRAPIEQVFARLADVEGHNEWMPDKGSMLRRTRQTSAGPPGLGTTYEDSTTVGLVPGEIVEFDPPRRIVHHWWDSTRSGRIKMEGWPGYTLESTGDNETLVRHHAKLRAHGIYRMATPVLKRMALKERTVTLEALQKSFE
ncbi:SRPBCC family protein [Nocardioides astragali]|uniref:SRPBCC family protein n=1 Tax=Nocardioides astragali TaxID=1776736 RepID=A0ABW2MZ79_9ACTN|nr:SRPBCC family protein [Nocardioides astragali]